MNKQRHVGGSIFPSSSRAILQPIETPHGLLQVREMPSIDSHGLFSGADTLLAQHPNGFSCHALAERMVTQPHRVRDQADYIVECGGVVTAAGWAAVAAVEVLT